MTRLEQGGTAPDFALRDDTGPRFACRTPRQQGGPVRLPGRDDARLHDAGLRLPRLAPVARGGRLASIGISPDTPEKLAKFRERTA